jgi:hypothetical protein
MLPGPGGFLLRDAPLKLAPDVETARAKLHIPLDARE